ncbi:unnamed protein product [Somion occarium]|uniref:FAD/NAD(P)-binding domain-containing protein n=1 Tax=Somion occarium TaxID=3059160 RepID=A0ABP1DNC4_9APHY
MSRRNDDRKDIVIVGGGWAGFILTRALSAKLDPAKYNLILVTARRSFIHLIASARMVVTSEGKLENQAIFPYDGLFVNGNGTHVVGTVTAIDEVAPGKGGDVILTNDERIHYDVLALATGSTWSGPLNFPQSDAEVIASINDWRNKIANAKHVVVVGGGAVGIEIAGEIKDTYPKKKVTLVHSEKQLLNDVYPDKWRQDIERRVRKRNIDLILGDRLDSFPEPGAVGVTTRNGKQLRDADLIIPAFGARPNTAYLSSLDTTVLSEQGFVKVKPTLEVVNHPSVFALGDIIDWPEQKQAAKTKAHADVVAANIQSYLTGQPLSKVYKGSPEMIVVPLGKSGGSGYLGILWGVIVGDWLTKLLKGKTLMVPPVRKEFGLA